MTRKQIRALFVLGGVCVIAGAVGLVLTALRQNIVYFYGPTDMVAEAPAPAKRVRLGGLVENGSVNRGADNMIGFNVTDGAKHIPVRYRGLLPDLFREGQGVVAEGKLQNGVFMAETVLAKHDERYMPPEVEEVLKKQGVWRGPGQSAAQ